MLASQIPTKFPLIWGQSAGGPFIRPIPTDSQIGIQNGAASLNDGFPPDCFTPVAAGGVPPFGQDFNGIFNQVTAWLQFVQAGAGIWFYDPTFSTQIGGYPSGAMLQSTAGAGNFWISTADNNTTDPDSGGAANWIAFPGTALVNPSTIQKTNTTFGFNCQTDYSLGLLRASPAAMTVNLAATGTLVLNQVFEVWDLSANVDLGPVTINPPAPGGSAPSLDLIAGASQFIMTNPASAVRLKFFGYDGGFGYWGRQNT